MGSILSFFDRAGVRIGICVDSVITVITIKISCFNDNFEPHFLSNPDPIQGAAWGGAELFLSEQSVITSSQWTNHNGCNSILTLLCPQEKKTFI